MTSTDEPRFALRLAEVETGIVLDSNGRWATKNAAMPILTCRTWAEALAEKDALLRRFPFAEVWIYDVRAQQLARRFRDEVGFPRYAIEQARWNRWIRAFPPCRLFMRTPRDPRP